VLPLLRSVFLVFEYCHHDLARLMDAMPKSFSESEVKGLLLQVSRGQEAGQGRC
jgi:serine/threonine protein kinase